MSPSSLAILKENLFVVDLGFFIDSLGFPNIGNQRIQIFKIKPNGIFSYKSSFGKRGKDLGEIDTPNDLTIKDNHLYVADSGNNRIQVLEIKY